MPEAIHYRMRASHTRSCCDGRGPSCFRGFARGRTADRRSYCNGLTPYGANAVIDLAMLNNCGVAVGAKAYFWEPECAANALQTSVVAHQNIF